MWISWLDKSVAAVNFRESILLLFLLQMDLMFLFLLPWERSKVWLKVKHIHTVSWLHESLLLWYSFYVLKHCYPQSPKSSESQWVRNCLQTSSHCVIVTVLAFKFVSVTDITNNVNHLSWLMGICQQHKLIGVSYND